MCVRLEIHSHNIAFPDILPVSFVPKYFGSEWSYAQVRGLEGKCICAFDRDHPRIIVSCLSGSCCRFDLIEFGLDCRLCVPTVPS